MQEKVQTSVAPPPIQPASAEPNSAEARRGFFFALSAYVLLLAARAGASRTVLLRMLANLGTDAVVGAVPLAGDLFDAGFKANARNLALLEAHVAAPRETRRASRLFVAGVVVAAVAIVVLVVAGMVALVRAIA